MSGIIEEYSPQSGRVLKEDSTIINTADILDSAQDKTSLGLKVIPTDTTAIRAGNGFRGNLFHASLAAAGTIVFRITAPTTKYAHIKSINAAAQGATIKIDFIRDATTTDVGTIVADAINNLNHNSVIDHELEIYDGAAAYTDGTIWGSFVVHGDTTVQAGAGSDDLIRNPNIEFITKKSVDYFILITNLSAADAAINILFSFFFIENA